MYGLVFVSGSKFTFSFFIVSGALSLTWFYNGDKQMSFFLCGDRVTWCLSSWSKLALFVCRDIGIYSFALTGGVQFHIKSQAKPAKRFKESVDILLYQIKVKYAPGSQHNPEHVYRECELACGDKCYYCLLFACNGAFAPGEAGCGSSMHKAIAKSRPILSAPTSIFPSVVPQLEHFPCCPFPVSSKSGCPSCPGKTHV